MKTATTPRSHNSSSKKTCKDNNEKKTADDYDLDALLELLNPTTRFHQKDEEAAQDDLRMLWDVRIVHGNDTPLCHVHGTSSLPSILVPDTRLTITDKIQKEITENVMWPLFDAIYSQIEDSTKSGHAEQE